MGKLSFPLLNRKMVFETEICKQDGKGKRECFLGISVSIQCIRMDIVMDDGEIGLEEKKQRFLPFRKKGGSTNR